MHHSMRKQTQPTSTKRTVMLLSVRGGMGSVRDRVWMIIERTKHLRSSPSLIFMNECDRSWRRFSIALTSYPFDSCRLREHNCQRGYSTCKAQARVWISRCRILRFGARVKPRKRGTAVRDSCCTWAGHWHVSLKLSCWLYDTFVNVWHFVWQQSLISTTLGPFIIQGHECCDRFTSCH